MKGRLQELLYLFLKLGTIAFGGPAAHIAMMQDEVVRRRQWLTNAEFLDLLSATNMIPGPNSTELAIHIGHRRGGWRGLLVAGLAFILPATIIVMGCAWVYVRFGSLPQMAAILYGVKPVIIAVVVQALWGLGKTALPNVTSGLLLALALALYLGGCPEIAVLVVVGLAAILVRVLTGRLHMVDGGAAIVGGGFFGNLFGPTSALAAAAPQAVSLTGIFAFFAKVGSVLFGSGYVLLAFLRSDLVERFGWLTESQLLDAIVVGQITPGPVFTTATFIGYVLAGPSGAVVATVGIFLPAFIFVALSGPLVPRLRRSKAASAFLDGLNVASLALMAVVAVQLARSALVDGVTLVLAAASAVLLIRFKWNSASLVAGGALLGWVVKNCSP